jgi:hypothetical protein
MPVHRSGAVQLTADAWPGHDRWPPAVRGIFDQKGAAQLFRVLRRGRLPCR